MDAGCLVLRVYLSGVGDAGVEGGLVGEVGLLEFGALHPNINMIDK